MNTPAIWLGVGFAGQFLFSMRFLVQWIQSERKRKSVIPTAFWYLSILGGLTLLSYAIYKQDPVFIVGQSAGVLVYTRNLILLHKEKKQKSEQQ